MQDFIAVNPGDIVLSMNVISPNRRKGVCVVKNLTRGGMASEMVSALKSTTAVRGWNAEWVVEDFQVGGEPVPFVGFGKVRFQGCAAEAGRLRVVVEDARVYEMVIDGGVVAEVGVQVEVDGDGVVVRDTRGV
ncbi:peptidase G1 [Aspergillus spectabilis]